MTARTATLTWAALVTLTLATWLLARGVEGGWVIGALITLAGIKIYLILAVFMGVRRAPGGWHAAALIWVVLLMAVIGTLAWRSLA